jgi:hypothetical protein
MRMMRVKFERWFKSRDESGMNERIEILITPQCAVKDAAAEKRVDSGLASISTAAAASMLHPIVTRR